ncbi:MAG: NAD-dependent epimerase/dehydratase family protein [Bacteroidetes bacterium]|nr:NAD-dependent epimerase/dehydratase family protein [Bacteroidota bacterium]
MSTERILIIGSGGQLGTELCESLRGIYGDANVIASDVRPLSGSVAESGPSEVLDILDKNRFTEILDQYKPTQIYHLAALLSATAEKNPKLGWTLNMDGLFHVLDAAKERNLAKVYWPSSIAVFGPNTPRVQTPQHCVMDPNTIYGITKLAGERYCEYYFEKHGVDVRSIRYPGLIGYKSAPGGGTTDYAVDIYHQALEHGKYECFLSSETELPMLYMPDALRATISLMEAPAEQIQIRSSYNVAGMSFTPEQIAASIRHDIPGFEISYAPDYRQHIADSWPKSIDDGKARMDWGWKPEYDLQGMTDDMLMHLREMKSQKV